MSGAAIVRARRKVPGKGMISGRTFFVGRTNFLLLVTSYALGVAVYLTTVRFPEEAFSPSMSMVTRFANNGDKATDRRRKSEKTVRRRSSGSSAPEDSEPSSIRPEKRADDHRNTDPKWWRGTADFRGTTALSHPHFGARGTDADADGTTTGTREASHLIVDPSPERLVSSGRTANGDRFRAESEFACPTVGGGGGDDIGIEGEEGNKVLRKIRAGLEKRRSEGGASVGKRALRQDPASALASGRRSRILCMVYTVDLPEPRERLRAIVDTWGRDCDGFWAASNATDHDLGAIDLPHAGPEEYGNIWQKVRTMWTYAYDHYLEEFDFFHICGDDAYAVVENLRSFLDGPDVLRLEEGHLDEVSRKPKFFLKARKWLPAKPRRGESPGSNDAASDDRRGARPLFFGLPYPRRIVGVSDQNFLVPAGGPGYTLNRAALELFGRKGADDWWADRKDPKEDFAMGSFFASEGVFLSHVLDRAGGWRFGEGADFLGRWHAGIPAFNSPKRLKEEYGLESGDFLAGVSDEFAAFHLKTELRRLSSEEDGNGRNERRTVADLIYRYHAVLHGLC